MSKNKGPYLVFVTIAVGVALFSAIILYLLHKKEYLKMESAAYSLSHSSMLLIKSQLNELDSIITTISNDYFLQSSSNMAKIVDTLFKHYKKVNPLIYEMGLLDKNGEVIVWSSDEMPPAVEDMEYVRHHLNSSDSTIYLSPPLLSRTSQDKWILVLSRAIRKESGELLGVGIGIFDIGALENLFDANRENKELVLSLIHANGDVILHSPRLGDITGKKASIATQLKGTNGVQKAVVDTTKDGKKRLAYIHTVYGYELFTVGAVAIDDWLKEWRIALFLFMGGWAFSLVAGFLGARRWSRYIWDEEHYQKEQKEIKDALERAQEIASVGNWSWDIKSNRLYLSDEIYRIFGVAPQEFGASYEAFLEFVHKDDREFVKESVNRALAKELDYDIFHRIVRRDGMERIVHERGEILWSNAGEPLRMDGVVQDVTEWKRAEETILNINKELEERVKKEVEARYEQEKMLIQSSKLAAMGELTTQLAHHWRQPLNVLMLNIDTMHHDIVLEPIKDIESFEKKIESSKEMILKLSDMISKFNSFYRVSKNQSTYQLQKSIQKVVDFFKSSYQENIKINADTSGDTYLHGIQNDLEHALLQILVNARDAFIDRGVKDPKIDISLRTEGTDCVITISDNAGGIDEKIMDRIFEPYFTTKFSSLGVGMSLYVVYNIIKQLRGDIKAYNSSVGAVFEIRLPTVESVSGDE